MCTAVEKRFQKQGSRTRVIVMCVNARIMRLFWLLVSRGARSTDQARGQGSESNKLKKTEINVPVREEIAGIIMCGFDDR